jgi:hypothetical protein
MLLSIFTPTHDVKHLQETYESLRVQDHGEWEWLVGLNGAARDFKGEFSDGSSLARESRVKIFKLPVFGSANVGALKAACCQRAQGEVLVELDHDDILVPGILPLVVSQFESGADFVYSDSASFESDSLKPVHYSDEHGWETYDFRLYEKELVATRTFPITPRSLCEVYYAPDHIRCWRRSFYNEIGGHDCSLSVGDDHDLVCRSYLARGVFAHTGTVGYVYRFHPGNTVKARNAKIQQQNNANRAKYTHNLIDEWCRRDGLLYVDLKKVEWQEDLPMLQDVKTNSVGCIRAYSSLRHVPTAKVPGLFEEFFRILVPGGWLCIREYSTTGPGGFLPSSKSYWNTLSFEFFTDKSRALEIQPMRARFQKVQCYEAYADVATEQPSKAISVYADLCAVKNQRQPGIVKI